MILFLQLLSLIILILFVAVFVIIGLELLGMIGVFNGTDEKVKKYIKEKKYE